jgi:hypothetical protein
MPHIQSARGKSDSGVEGVAAAAGGGAEGAAGVAAGGVDRTPDARSALLNQSDASSADPSQSNASSVLPSQSAVSPAAVAHFSQHRLVPLLMARAVAAHPR